MINKNIPLAPFKGGDFYEISFSYDTSIETGIINDILASELGNIGFDSFISEDTGLLAYIETGKFRELALEDCLNNFPLQDIRFYHTLRLIKSCNWNEEWEKNYFQPVAIEKECLIRASFHSEIKGFKYTLVIDPKMAFGTGNHATTHLMLSELLQLDVKGKAFLDMGCGTAVLAILAAIKEASQIVAIDIDEWAYENAIENCRLNRTEQIKVVLGGAEQIDRYGTFDYIFANINRNILLNDIHRYVPALNPEGSLFMSGFYKDDIPAIEAECRRYGLILSSFKEKDDWVATHFVYG